MQLSSFRGHPPDEAEARFTYRKGIFDIREAWGRPTVWEVRRDCGLGLLVWASHKERPQSRQDLQR